MGQPSDSLSPYVYRPSFRNEVLVACWPCDGSLHHVPWLFVHRFFQEVRLNDQLSFPSQTLQSSPHLPLSDIELAWIGVVTAYWAFGEQFLEILISIFGGPLTPLKKTTGFEGKIELAKKVIRDRSPTNSPKNGA
jgi:hypothetical protein